MLGWATETGRLEVIRGRQGRQGFKDLPLSTFLDMVWVEIYDDCSPMGDRHEYREIITKLFLKGEDPHNIWVGEGKTRHRLSASPRSKTTKADLADLRALQQQAIELAKARQAEPE